MWSEVLIGFLVLRCADSTLPPKPINVSFTSVNLRNVLHWFPGHGSPHDTHFTVEYAIYGKPFEVTKGKRVMWGAVRQCTDISRTWCDLSAEMEDVEQGYYARVHAVWRRSTSKWAVRKQRFDPKSETVFGPPFVSVEIENNSAVITLKGPMRYSTNHSLMVPMNTIYPHTSYNLSIHNTHLNQMHHVPVTISPYKYQLMEYNTKYCFSAKSRFVSIQMRSESSAWYCLTTPKDPVIEQLQKSLVGIVIPSLCICMIVVVGYLLYTYLSGKDQKSPVTLTPPSFFSSPLNCPEKNANLIVISVINEEPPPYPKNQPGNTNPPPSYASQIPPPMPSQESDESLDSLSVDYCAVSRENERRASTYDGDNGNNLMGQHQMCPAHTSLSVSDYAPQVTCLCQKWAHKGDQSNVSKNPQAEAGVLLQARLLSGPVTGEKNDGEASGLFISRNLKTGLFDIHLNICELKEVEKREQIDENTMEDDKERNKSENVPLLSGYAPQNVTNTHPVNSDQSDSSSYYCGVLTLPAAQKAERNEPEGERELSGLKPSERGGEDRIAGKDEYMMRGGLKLEGLLFKQASDEEEEEEICEDTKWDVDDVFSKWNLVIS